MKKDRRPRKLRPIAEAPATAASSDPLVDAGGWLQNLDDAALAHRLDALTALADEAAALGDEIKAAQVEAKAAPFRRETTRRLSRVGV